MSNQTDTPRTDDEIIGSPIHQDECKAEMVFANFARTLERELSAAKEREGSLREALEGLLREAVVLSDDYLAAFTHKRDDECIQGWDKARWLRASAARKVARAALAEKPCAPGAEG